MTVSWMSYLEITMYLITFEFLLFSKEADVNWKKHVFVFLGSELTFRKLHLLLPSLN